jgi:hypothetical protein
MGELVQRAFWSRFVLFSNRLPAFPTRVAFGVVPGAGRPFQRIMVFPCPFLLFGGQVGEVAAPVEHSVEQAGSRRPAVRARLRRQDQTNSTTRERAAYSQWKRLLKRLPNLGAKNKSMSRVEPFGDPASAAVCPPPSDGKHRRTNGSRATNCMVDVRSHLPGVGCAGGVSACSWLPFRSNLIHGCLPKRF